MEDQRRLVLDVDLPPTMSASLGKSISDPFRSVAASTRCWISALASAGTSFMTASASKWAYQRSSGCISANVAHALAIAARAGEHGVAPVLVRQAIRARGEHERGRQPLDVPFPRSRQRLVEIVDVEEELRSGVAKPPKFSRWQSPQACTRMPVSRCRGEVGRHHAQAAPR